MAEQPPSPRLDDTDVNVDEELKRMQAQLAEMEAEKHALEKDAPDSAGGEGETADANMDDDEAPAAVDARSVYIGNVDYGATPEEIQAHFQACGTINRVTILCDKFSGHPKGYAYVEFADPSVVQNALVLNESSFRGRLITVREKRTNVPGMNMTNRGRGRGRGRGRPFRGRGRGRGRGW
ncbi:cytoplasmic RNA-binding protein [Apiotrichum porosum]|uniref:Cytoplasmic RNA-binding protein n=1 Tax=Apiotrichum porosum TaxID=105984 RepID=A0A427XSV2_9TREE|nr:cytoplasmic RNA-binding protein [Apiotrichum porosum]RSH81878.1 cytoplasmic RNA-binding protein [Apiotrichum porosum]